MVRKTSALSASAIVTALGILLTCGPATAAPVDCLASGCEVSDNGATITTDSGEQDLDSFVVGGVDHLSEREFHINFGVNSAGNPIADDDISDVLSIDSATEDEDTNQIVVVFSDSDVRVTVTYTLMGGAGSALVRYTTVVDNLLGDQLDLTLVDYIDPDLNDSSGGDVVHFDGVRTIMQQEGTTIFRARSISPFDYVDVGECCEDELYSRKVGGHLSGDVGPDGPGDEVGAFQNNISLADSASITILRELEIAIERPAPALSAAGLAVAILLLFMVGLYGSKRRSAAGG